MARIGYPTSCLSEFCGQIVCDGCQYRPALAAYHERIGESREFEERQQRARELMATINAESADRSAA